MKKIILINILLLSFLAGFSHSAYAVKAYPGPIQVTQPDGSVITIRKHGDEFLNWTTYGNLLVKQGTDGFYYLAEFSAQGAVQATATRVQPGLSLQGPSTIAPPAVARERAQRLRQGFAQTFSARSDVSRLLPGITPAVKGPAQSIAIGQKKFLVILAAFSDLAFNSASAQNDFFNLLNQDGYAENGGTGSVWNYYYENSAGAFDPQFDVVGPVTLSRSFSYYGANDEEGNNMAVRAREMVIEAIRIADQSFGVDFSQYDNDGDGTIDNVFVYFAGHNEAEGGGDNTIWPHAWSTYNESITVDGVTTSSYACTSELRAASGTSMAGIGTYCHEFGHVLGLPDFYDTDGDENGAARGVGAFSLMSGGNYNNVGRTPPYLTIIERTLLGWRPDSFEELSEEGQYELGAVPGNQSYVTLTGNDGEFFLYEFRQKDGWDANLPNSGLLIYHIDMSENMVGGKSAVDRWRSWDGINSYASHQCCDLVEAVYPESAISFDNQIPFPGSTNNTSFTDTSSPAAVDFAGNPTGVYLSNITDNADRATFTVSISNVLVITGTVSDIDGNPVAGAEISLSFEEPSATGTVRKTTIMQSGPLFSTAKTTSREEVATVTTDENGSYVFETITRPGIYHLEAFKEGFSPIYDQVDGSRSGTYIVNLTMSRLGEGILKKHGPWEGYAIGYGSPGGTIFGAVGFSAQELAPYEGSTIASMSFLVAGTSAAEVGVFITAGDQILFSGVLNNPSFEVMMQLELSSFGIIIPGGADVKFGYYVTDSDSGYPLAADNGPMVPMGGYVGGDIASLTETWKDLYDIDVNIQISAMVAGPDNQLFSLGYYMIPYTGRTYRTGDTFTFRLNDDPSVEGVERPESVNWFFDDQPYNTGDEITLAEGNHTVKVVLTFSDHTQTVVYEIECGAAENQSID
jgi:M6 family metalloprotease-like protein